MIRFLSGFWGYVSGLLWWQGLIVITIVLITFSIGKFWRDIITWIGDRITSKNETLQYRMYWGLIKDALFGMIKDELRRSCRDNGFCNLGGTEFSSYVKGKTDLVIDLLKQHLINLYPPKDNRLIVSIETILDYIDSQRSDVQDLMFDIFIESKNIKLTNEKKLNEIEQDFVKDINSFVKNNKGNNSNCESCLLILFGKREIMETKRKKVHTLSTQMVVVDHKLFDWQTKLLDFYSSELNRNK